jgi:hypothetical protein
MVMMSNSSDVTISFDDKAIHQAKDCAGTSMRCKSLTGRRCRLLNQIRFPGTCS